MSDDAQKDLEPEAEAAPPENGAAADPAAPEPEAEPEAPTLEDQIAALEAEKAAMNDKLLRALAEIENVRRRSEKQTADARVYAIERFARDLLSVTDNLARALEALPDDARAELSEAGRSLLSGVELTHTEMVSVLARHGVTAIDASPGAPFDPNLHQAVSQIPSEHPAGSIAAPFQAGWKIGERTLRAAMVAVSAGPAS